MNKDKQQITVEVFTAARRSWLAAKTLRERRNRYKRFTFGDQWSDTTFNDRGETLREGDLAKEQGMRPMTNNLIRQMVKSVVGYYRNSLRQEPPKHLTQAYNANKLDELDARTLEEFLISGCAIQRISHENRPEGGHRQWVDMVNPARFFVNSINDPRGIGVNLIGQLHDMTIDELTMRFAHGSRRRAEELRAIYSSIGEPIPRLLGESLNSSLTFSVATDGLCRVIEVWTRDYNEHLRCHDLANGRYYTTPLSREQAIIADNKRRLEVGIPLVDYAWNMDCHWHCRFISPDGQLLDELDSPTGSHPYAFKFYPLIDGEIHPLVEDVIDQQKFINHLVTLNEHILATSAKGVLLFPENQVSKQMSVDDIAKQWANPGGFVLYRAQQGLPGPEQAVSGHGDLGINQLISLQMKLIDDISGVSGAMRGQSAQSGTSATLYESQQHHAATALADLYGAFASFVECRDSILC